MKAPFDDEVHDKLKEKFLNPPNSCRAFPFWAWNARLDAQEIKEQARQMHEQGMGGFFMHSREGLETEYMGKEWMDCVQTAVNEAKEHGMYSWLYDEDRWPSGTAGGRVTQIEDAYRLKGLTLEVTDSIDDSVFAEAEVVYLANVHENNIDGFRKISSNAHEKNTHESNKISSNNERVLKDNEKFLVVRLEVSGTSPWFNNETPPDNLNPGTVEKFISLTHEKYHKLFKSEFGKTIPGIFTDEPSLADSHAKFSPKRSWIPWTYGFKAFFEKRMGYDPFDLLPYLYFNGKDSRKIRHDYWHAVTIRFSESYTKQIRDWCRSHNLLMTGHFLQEDRLGLATRVNGAVMPHYEYEDVPAIDILQERTDEFMTVKQCTSVARQMGRPHVLSETYGCTGWEFTFEGQRYLGDWQYALGINKRCQHLSLYSIAGCRKRDYPPCFNYNTSWWGKTHIVEDYFARLGAVLEEGTAQTEILLLHPSTTAWSLLGTSPYGNPVRRLERDVPHIDERGYEYNRLIKTLCFHHFDMDLGDEIIMSKYADANGKSLKVGAVEYSVVIIPKVDTILDSTLLVLQEYVNAGGLLIVMEPVPEMVNARQSGEISTLFNNENCKTVKDKAELLELLENSNIRTVRIKDKFGNEDTNCLVMHRKTGQDEILFIVNNDRDNGHNVTVELCGEGGVEQWDPLSAEIYQVEAKEEDNKRIFHVYLDAADSKLFRIYRNRKSSAYINTRRISGIKDLDKEKILYEFPESTEIRTMSENALTLDRCQYVLGQNDKKWSEETEVWQAQKQIRETLDMQLIHLNGIEQRYRWIHKKHPHDNTPVKLRFVFDVLDLPDEDVFLALEHPEYFEILCNGKRIDNKSSGYLLDKDIKRVKLSYVRLGENEITLECKYMNSMELEDCYLCGEFGVSVDRKIIAKPEKLHIGDWTRQGLLHYFGSVCYDYSFMHEAETNGRIILELGDYSAICATLYINENKIEVPWKSVLNMDITDYIVTGFNKLTIEIMGSPRNLFGPFHLAEKKRLSTNDKCFRVEGDAYTQDYNVEPYGLFSAPQIYQRETENRDGIS